MVETDFGGTDERPRCRYHEFLHCKLEVNYLAKILCENSTVRELRLPNNGITNEGVNILAKGLCKNSTLETLNLFENDFGFKYESPTKFTGMAEMLASNDKLKKTQPGS